MLFMFGWEVDIFGFVYFCIKSVVVWNVVSKITYNVSSWMCITLAATVVLQSCEMVMPSVWWSFVVCCVSAYRVQYLDLSMAVISVQTLEELLSCCVCLLKLSLESCQLNNNICRSIPATSLTSRLVGHVVDRWAKQMYLEAMKLPMGYLVSVLIFLHFF